MPLAQTVYVFQWIDHRLSLNERRMLSFSDAVFVRMFARSLLARGDFWEVARIVRPAGERPAEAVREAAADVDAMFFYKQQRGDRTNGLRAMQQGDILILNGHSFVYTTLPQDAESEGVPLPRPTGARC